MYCVKFMFYSLIPEGVSPTTACGKGYSMQHYVIMFVNDIQLFSVASQVSPAIKLTTKI